MGVFSWFGGRGKRPSVSVSKGSDGKFVYKLTDHDLGVFRSCLSGGYSEANMLFLFETIPEVFCAVDIIASRVQNGEFLLKRLDTDEVVWDNKYWNKLLARPNWQQTWNNFIYALVVHKYTCGNRYVYSHVPEGIQKKLENIVALWPLPPQFTDPIIKKDRTKHFTATEVTEIVEKYVVSLPGDSDEFKPELVCHDAFLSFGRQENNRLKGIAPLRASEMPMSNIMAVYGARNAIYTKRGAIGMIVSKKTDESGTDALTPSEKTEVHNELQKTYGVTGDREILGVTSSPVEFVRIAMSIQEMQPFEETYASTASVFSNLGIPRSFIPTKDGPTYTNGPADERKLYQDVIMKNGFEICQILNSVLGVGAIGCYVDVSYEHVEVLQEDKKSKAEKDKLVSDIALQQYDKGFITKNQVRVAIGQEEVPGDDVFVTDGKSADSFASLEVGKLQAMKDLLVSGLPPQTIKNNLIAIYGASEQQASKMVEGLTERQPSNSNQI